MVVGFQRGRDVIPEGGRYVGSGGEDPAEPPRNHPSARSSGSGSVRPGRIGDALDRRSTTSPRVPSGSGSYIIWEYWPNALYRATRLAGNAAASPARATPPARSRPALPASPRWAITGTRCAGKPGRRNTYPLGFVPQGVRHEPPGRFRRPFTGLARCGQSARIGAAATCTRHPSGVHAATQAEPGPRGRTGPVPGLGRVIVGASGSPGSLGALRYGDVLARAHQALLVPVIAWEPPGGTRPAGSRIRIR